VAGHLRGFDRDRSAYRPAQELTLRETGDLAVRRVALPVSDGAL